MRPYMPPPLMCHVRSNRPAIQRTLRQRDKRPHLTTNLHRTNTRREAAWRAHVPAEDTDNWTWFVQKNVEAFPSLFHDENREKQQENCFMRSFR